MVKERSRRKLGLVMGSIKHNKFSGILMILICATAIVTAESSRDVEIEKLLKKFNKQAVKSIQSADGDIIDCVDFYKQPAFDHPLLKNQTIKMRPSFIPQGLEKSNSTGRLAQQLWLQSGRCPKGTISIRRVRKSDLLRADSSENFAMVHPIHSTDSRDELVGAKLDSNDVGFNGIRADISVWTPLVQPGENSVSTIYAIGADLTNAIGAGWGVSRSGFVGDQPRLYAAWRSSDDNGRLLGCDNMLCPGFVQCSPRVALGSVISPVSDYDAELVTITPAIYADNEQNKWWLMLGDEIVGFWPFSIFRDLHSAKTVSWVGSIYNKRVGGRHTITQMGSGRFSSEGHRRAAFFSKIQYMDHHNTFLAPPLRNLRFAAPFPNCYNYAEVSYNYGGLIVPAFYYGGPGGVNCDAA